MKIVLDTNVIIDAFASREPWNADAEEIFLLASKEKLEVVICASAVTDIFYICNKVFHNNTKARKVIKTLLNLFNVEDVKKKDLQNALSLDISNFEDALVCALANRVSAQFIVTRNTGDFAKSPVKAITPQEFLAKYYK